MRHCVWIIIVMKVLSAGTGEAAEFQPTLLKIEGKGFPSGLGYPDAVDFSFFVSGTPANVLLAVFTAWKGEDMPETLNGFLGWHYINKVDTCVYFTSPKYCEMGENVIHWDARNLDGNKIEMGAYHYYLWAYDSSSPKELVSKHVYCGLAFDYTAEIQEVDERGMPFANPIWYTAEKRWMIGSDPEDTSALISSTITLENGWFWRGDSVLQADDFSFEYISVSDSSSGSLQKIKFVPGGDAEIIYNWGVTDSYAETYPSANGESAGVCSDGTYLFTTDVGLNDNETIHSNFYIYDTDGYLVEDIDLSPWWSSQENADAGGLLNGGPVNFSARDRYIFLNSHASCLNQMIDPTRYLDTGEFNDLIVWSNRNGDYYGDKHFEETAVHPWLCNDDTAMLYKYSCSVDNKMFSIYSAYDVGAASFGLFAPDGTGLGYFAFYGDFAWPKYGVKCIDSDTPYDGIYCDKSTWRQSYNPDYDPIDGLGFIAHDNYKGFLPFYPCAIDDNPASVPITLSPNRPNPFNPVTTIPFSLAEETEISLIVYNVAGEKIETLAEGRFSAGEYSVDWNASKFASGVYFYRLSSGSFTDTRKMTVVK